MGTEFLKFAALKKNKYCRLLKAILIDRVISLGLHRFSCQKSVLLNFHKI